LTALASRAQLRDDSRLAISLRGNTVDFDVDIDRSEMQHRGKVNVGAMLDMEPVRHLRGGHSDWVYLRKRSRPPVLAKRNNASA